MHISAAVDNFLNKTIAYTTKLFRCKIRKQNIILFFLALFAFLLFTKQDYEKLYKC